MSLRSRIVFLVLTASLARPVWSQTHAEAGTPGTQVSKSEGSSVIDGGWFDEWPHRHLSPRGTPYVHLFNLEPAFLDRDVFFDYRQTRSKDGTESEFEFELEWAFTRRLGLVVEAPLIHVDEDGGDAHTGVGDFAISPRVLLVDTDSFLLSANLEVAVPTGDQDRDLGAGETTLAPSFSIWSDLGNWISFQVQVGTEHGLESGDTNLSYKSALTWSFLTSAAQNPEPSHYAPGMTSLVTELTGRTVLDGNDETRTTAELLLGARYSVSGHLEVRGGYQFPVGGPEDMEHGFVLGVVFHF